MVQLIPFFEDRKEEINDHSDPYLSFYRILRSPIERFNSEILFYPLEEQFDFPAGFVKSGNCCGGKSKVI